MKVFLMPSDSVSSTTVLAMVKTGSAHEKDDEQGISHFVEHVSLTALKSLPTKEKLNNETEFMGAKFNASTGLQVVNYYITVPYTKVSFGINFIYETLYECTLNPEYIEQERKIILDEISKIEDSIDHQNLMFVWKELTKKNSGYIRPIAGTQDAMKSFPIDKVKDTYKKMHSPNKVLFSIVGNFKSAEVKKQIEELFNSQMETQKVLEYPEDSFKSGIVKAKASPKTDLIITSLEFPSGRSIDYTQKDLNQISVMSSIFCGPMSSRLKNRLREKENLLYHIHSSIETFQTFGHSYIEYDIPPELFEKTFKIVLEEIEKFYDKGVTEKELAHYKEYLINRILISNDTVYQYSSPIRSDLFWDREPLNIDQVIEIIKDTTVGEINSLFRKCMDINKINGFAFGNTSDDTESIMKTVLKKYIR